MPSLVGPAGSVDIDGDWSVDASALEVTTGWQLKAEGLCQADVCIVVPDELRKGGRVDAPELWRRIGRPVLESGDAMYLGEGASTRREALTGGMAPDFALRDLAGLEHRLSDQRGRKVLLASWAPW